VCGSIAVDEFCTPQIQLN